MAESILSGGSSAFSAEEDEVETYKVIARMQQQRVDQLNLALEISEAANVQRDLIARHTQLACLRILQEHNIGDGDWQAQIAGVVANMPNPDRRSGAKPVGEVEVIGVPYASSGVERRYGEPFVKDVAWINALYIDAGLPQFQIRIHPEALGPWPDPPPK